MVKLTKAKIPARETRGLPSAWGVSLLKHIIFGSGRTLKLPASYLVSWAAREASQLPSRALSGS